MATSKDVENYFNAVQEEILIKRKQLKCLISQSTILGSYYEEIMRDVISRFVPKRFSLTTGMLAYGEESSKQMDIIIYDNNESYPIFSTERKVVISPTSVRAIIEVKSEITTRSLKKAIENLRSAIDIYSLSKHPSLQTKLFTMIVGFASDMKLETLNERVEKEGIEGIVIFSKRRDGKMILGQFNKLMMSLAHKLKYQASYPRELLKESGYLKD